MTFRDKVKASEYGKYWRAKNKERIKKYNREVRYAKYRRKIQQLKIEAVKYLGGKCEKCGYNKNYSALDFHHKDGRNGKEDKDIAYLLHSYSKKKLFIELKKCQLLCSNCHREIHFPNLEMNKSFF